MKVALLALSVLVLTSCSPTMRINFEDHELRAKVREVIDESNNQDTRITELEKYHATD